VGSGVRMHTRWKLVRVGEFTKVWIRSESYFCRGRRRLYKRTESKPGQIALRVDPKKVECMLLYWKEPNERLLGHPCIRLLKLPGRGKTFEILKVAA
jgi:hypothetical protein